MVVGFLSLPTKEKNLLEENGAYGSVVCGMADVKREKLYSLFID